MKNLLEVASQFKFPAAIDSIEPHGSGIINDTYIVTFKNAPESGASRHGKRAVLQRINDHVFPDPNMIMQNLSTVLEHANKKTSAVYPGFILPSMYMTRQETTSVTDSEGKTWRALAFIENSVTFDILQNATQAREAGAALGAFHQLLSDIPVDNLHDTLPGFHDTPVYLAQYDAVAAQWRLNIAEENIANSEHFNTVDEMLASREFCFSHIENNRPLASLIYNAQPPIPLRITHGDPKLNNFLFDQDSGKAISIIDLDTIKAGYIHYDLGDCIRSCCNRGGEMPQDITDVQFAVDNFEAILRGYLSTAGGLLDKHDFELLYDVVRLLPFELGIRFFTDYLNGNRYFKVTSPDDNLYRARVQFELLNSIESLEKAVKNIIEQSTGHVLQQRD